MTEPTKKYEFTGETKVEFGVTLKRIRALITIPGVVDAGALGGWIEDERNLSVEVYDKAWVFGEAQVYGRAWVYGKAWVYGEARVYDKAWVSGDAQVYGEAHVYGNAWVYGEAQVYGNAWVYGEAQVYGEARVSGEAQVSISPLYMSGFTYPITITDQYMQIGCQVHAITEWRAFDDRRIAEMDGLTGSHFWRDFGPTLLALCDISGRPIAREDANTAEAR